MSFFDDAIIEDLMKFLPVSEMKDVLYRHVRRVLWKRDQAQAAHARQEQGGADAAMSTSDFGEASEQGESEPLDDDSVSAANVPLPPSIGSINMGSRQSMATRNDDSTVAHSSALADASLPGHNSDISQDEELEGAGSISEDQRQADDALSVADLDVGNDDGAVFPDDNEVQVLAPAGEWASPPDSVPASGNHSADTDDNQSTTAHDPPAKDALLKLSGNDSTNGPTHGEG